MARVGEPGGIVAVVKPTDELERGREAYDAGFWSDAAELLSAADSTRPLGPADLERLGAALFMIGRDEEHYGAWERAHRAYLEAGEARLAARRAFWIGMMQLLTSGEIGRSGGWLARAHRLLEHRDDCVERGYLLLCSSLPEIFRNREVGDIEGAVATAAAAAEAGRRYGDTDLFALAAHFQGCCLVLAGRPTEGLRLLDEAVLAASCGEVSPIPTGIIFCGAIVACHWAFDPRRAREWTQRLDAWCGRQPDLLAFTGDCHVHRAEVMEFEGGWDDALDALKHAARQAARAGNARVAAHAAYRRGEILRCRGDVDEAEAAFREAARGGHEPQPGLSLVRLARGDTTAAIASINRALAETRVPVQRARLLPAKVEIALAAGDLRAARAASTELATIASERGSDMLMAMVGQACGAVELAAGSARDALPHLRAALSAWQDLGARHEAARVRLLISHACGALGDADSSSLHLESARDAFRELGTAAPLENHKRSHGLTERELQVLRLVASGSTNKAIAAELVLSERTVDRHVSNIFAKLRVSSRAAATAYAYDHRLL